MSSELLNTSIAPISKTEQVVNRLIQYLKEADVKPGDEIPTELSLAANLGVSRPIIREALSHIKLLGLVEARKKRGMILAEPNFALTMEKMLLPKLLEGDTRQDIFELRLMLEVGIADSLFAKIVFKDILKLEAIIGEEKELKQQERTPRVIRKLVSIDTKFHAYLYKISNNAMLQSLQKVLLPTVKYVIAHQFKMDPLAYGKVSHEELIRILKVGSVNDFRIAMREHLALHFAEL